MYSVTSIGAPSSGLLMTPRNWTMWGWCRCWIMASSVRNSARATLSAVAFCSRFRVFTATVVPLHLARCTVPNAPSPRMPTRWTSPAGMSQSMFSDQSECMGTTPDRLLASSSTRKPLCMTLPPAALSSCASSLCLPRTADSNGVVPNLSTAFTGAFCSSSQLAMAYDPSLGVAGQGHPGQGPRRR